MTAQGFHHGINICATYTIFCANPTNILPFIDLNGIHTHTHTHSRAQKFAYPGKNCEILTLILTHFYLKNSLLFNNSNHMKSSTITQFPGSSLNNRNHPNGPDKKPTYPEMWHTQVKMAIKRLIFHLPYQTGLPKT